MVGYAALRFKIPSIFFVLILLVPSIFSIRVFLGSPIQATSLDQRIPHPGELPDVWFLHVLSSSSSDSPLLSPCPSRWLRPKSWTHNKGQTGWVYCDGVLVLPGFKQISSYLFCRSLSRKRSGILVRTRITRNVVLTQHQTSCAFTIQKYIVA